MQDQSAVKSEGPTGIERFQFDSKRFPEWVITFIALLVAFCMPVLVCKLLPDLGEIWTLVMVIVTLGVSLPICAGYAHALQRTAIQFDWDNNRVEFVNCYKHIPIALFPCVHTRSFPISDIYGIHTTRNRYGTTVYIYVGFGGAIVRSNLTNFYRLLDRLASINKSSDEQRG